MTGLRLEPDSFAIYLRHIARDEPRFVLAKDTGRLVLNIARGVALYVSPGDPRNAETIAALYKLARAASQMARALESRAPDE